MKADERKMMAMDNAPERSKAIFCAKQGAIWPQRSRMSRLYEVFVRPSLTFGA